MTVVMVGLAWVAASLFFVAMCAAAKRGERPDLEPSPEEVAVRKPAGAS